MKNLKFFIQKKIFISSIILAACIFVTNSEAQVLYDFGTKGVKLTSGTGTYISSFSGAEGFNNFPSTPSNIAMFYGFNSGSDGMLKAASPGLLRIGSQSEAQGLAGTVNNFTKFGVMGYAPQGTLFTYMKFDVVFAGDSLANSYSDSGVWYFCIGDGNETGKFMYNNTTSLTTDNCGLALRWTYGSNGTLTLHRYQYTSALSDKWEPVTSFIWEQKEKYTIELYINVVKQNGSITYTRSAVSNTLNNKTMDIYVNNQKICDGVTVSHEDNDPSVQLFNKMDSYCWYGTGAASGDQPWIFVDNAASAESAPTTYAFYTINTSSASLDLSQTSSWTSSNTGIGGTAPTNFSSYPNCTWYIRTYSPTPNTTFTLTNGNLDITGGTNSQIELGDNNNPAQFTIPSDKSCVGDMDIRSGGYLIVESSTNPTIRTTEQYSTVEYNNGSTEITYPLYYNFVIKSGTKTLIVENTVDGTATIGDGSSNAELIIPATKGFTGTVNVKNNGKVTIQNTQKPPTLGTLYTGSTVEYNGNASQNTNSGKTYHNLIVNNSVGVSMAGDNIINGTLTMTNGNLTMNGKKLTINGNVTGTGQFVAGTPVAMAPNNSSLEITGTGDAGTISFADGNNVLNNFTINRTTNGKVTFGSNVIVSGILTLTEGIVDLGSNILTLGTSTSSRGTLSFDYNNQKPNFKTWIKGQLKQYIPSGFTGEIQWPLGDRSESVSDQWGGARIKYTSATNAAGSLTGQFILGNPGSNNTGNILDNGYTIDRYSQYGYWTITCDAINQTLGGLYNLEIDAYNFTGLGNDDSKRNNLRILKRANNIEPWEVPGTHSNGSGNILQWTAIRNNLSTYSDFTLGSNQSDNTLGDAPLPVTLQSFTSALNGRNITLRWVTSSEINNSGFDIERKYANSSWQKIGFINGSGTKNSPTNYKYEDKNLNAGKYSYRLKQIDNNGNFEYYTLNGEIEISLPKKFELSQNYPNPFNPVTKIDFSLPFDSKVSIIIYDVTGREVKTIMNEALTAGYHTALFNGSGISSGIYFYRINASYNSGIFSLVKKMLLVK